MVSVPYWGSHYLINAELFARIPLNCFRPLLGFSLSNRLTGDSTGDTWSFRPLLGFSLSNRTKQKIWKFLMSFRPLLGFSLSNRWIDSYQITRMVSVPYWGSHYLIVFYKNKSSSRSRFRPLLGFSLSNQWKKLNKQYVKDFRPLLGFSLSNHEKNSQDNSKN